MVVAGLLVMFLVCTSLLGATKLLWYDEFLTYYPAKMSLPDLFAFYHNALDTQTPTQALLIKAVMSIFGDSHWAVRVPSILGFALACFCIYLFVERRLPRTYAVAAMMFPAATIAIYFATVARPYSLLLGFTALVMVCWQRASEENRHWGWVAALGFSLVACIFCHYYALVLWAPLAIAEFVRWRERGKTDFALWLVCLAAMCSILIFLPYIRVVGQTYSGGMLSSRLSPSRLQFTVLLVRTLIPFPLMIVIITLGLLSPLDDAEAEADADADANARKGIPRQGTASGTGTRNLHRHDADLRSAPGASCLASTESGYVIGTIARGWASIVVAALYWLCGGDRRVGAVLAIVFSGWFLLKTATALRANLAESGGVPLHAAQPHFVTTSG